MVRHHVQIHGEKLDSAALLTVSEEKCTCPKCQGMFTMWEAHRDEILKGLTERWTGFHPEFYATKDTYQEDAIRCYNLHRRPSGADCIDWHDDNRRVTPASWKGREVYLCDFCPVASAVTTAQRMALRMYDREPGEVD